MLQNHGWCDKGQECLLSHDVHQIVNIEEQPKKMNKKKRRREAKKLAKRKLRNLDDTSNAELHADQSTELSALSSCDTGDSETENTKAHNAIRVDPSASSIISNCHRAGLDAYMTGVIFTCFNQQLKGKTDINSLKNHIHLSGKNIPLLVTKGNFGKVSAAHKAKYLALKTQVVL